MGPARFVFPFFPLHQHIQRFSAVPSMTCGSAYSQPGDGRMTSCETTDFSCMDWAVAATPVTQAEAGDKKTGSAYADPCVNEPLMGFHITYDLFQVILGPKGQSFPIQPSTIHHL